MLIQFTCEDGRVIAVNPAHVRCVEPYGNDAKSLIHFGKDDFVTVMTGYQAAVNAIDSGLNRSE